MSSKNFNIKIVQLLNSGTLVSSEELDLEVPVKFLVIDESLKTKVKTIPLFIGEIDDCDIHTVIRPFLFFSSNAPDHIRILSAQPDAHIMLKRKDIDEQETIIIDISEFYHIRLTETPARDSGDEYPQIVNKIIEHVEFVNEVNDLVAKTQKKVDSLFVSDHVQKICSVLLVFLNGRKIEDFILSTDGESDDLPDEITINKEMTIKFGYTSNNRIQVTIDNEEVLQKRPLVRFVYENGSEMTLPRFSNKTHSIEGGFEMLMSPDMSRQEMKISRSPIREIHFWAE